MKRICALSVAVLALPITLAAQQPATTPQPQPANSITLSYKAFAEQYAKWLTAAFDSIPAGKYDYKPTPVQQTVGYIAQHLETANYQLCGVFGGVKPTMTTKDSLADTIKAKWPKDTLVARLKASFVFCDGAVARVTDATLTDALPAGPAGSGRTVVRARYVLGFVTDLADHWSQIANYMRLNGMVPPSALPRSNR
jgi:MFS-type transporter involved in bile tolerance (Atg22 family)